MIKSYLCDCCYACNHADIDYTRDELPVYSDYGAPYSHTRDYTIFCTQADVCKEYKKELNESND